MRCVCFCLHPKPTTLARRPVLGSLDYSQRVRAPPDLTRPSGGLSLWERPCGAAAQGGRTGTSPSPPATATSGKSYARLHDLVEERRLAALEAAEVLDQDV